MPAKSTISSSFTPRITTTLILSGRNPAASVASIPSHVSRKPSRRAMWTNFSPRSVSRLMLSRRRPASRSGRASFESRIPFVVIARSFTPGVDATSRTRSGRFRRAVGSPPVRRKSVIPSDTATRTIRPISSKVRISGWGIHSGSAGMQ